MSLKTRLLVLIVLLVTVIITVLSAVHLNSLVKNWTDGMTERSELAMQQVIYLVIERIQERLSDTYPVPETIEENKKVWINIVSTDRQLVEIIRKTILATKTIVELSIADEFGEILVSSDPRRIGTRMRPRLSFNDWKEKQVWNRLMEITSGEQDYEVTKRLGLPQQTTPIFTVQLVQSSALLRSFLLPQLYTLAAITAASLALSILFGAFSASLAIGPLDKIGKEIDRITRGDPSPQKDEDDDPLGKTRELAIVQSKLDVLGQRMRGAQEDAAQMRGNIESLMERMEDAVLLFDRYDRVILAGAAVERLLETRERVHGKRMDEVFPPATALGGVVQQAVRLNKAAKDQMVTFERPDRQPSRLLVNVTPLADRSGTLVTLRDAETRRQIASELDVSTRLAAMSRLTGLVAHEIKNPLNSIALGLELLRDKMADEKQGQITVISQEIRRLDRVVKTFLDFTRPVDFTAENVNLATLAKEVASLVTPQAATQKVNVEFIAEPENIVIRADRDLLKQAILNVVMNGIEAMRGGGRLKVRASRQEGTSVLTIQDDGPGIPTENTGKVFQLYFTTKEKGSGIGLAMTFRAVQLHNGTIEFTSEPGKGTTFQLKFPLSPQEA